MKKQNLKKILLSLSLGLVMILSLIPTNIGKLFSNSVNAAEKNVYKTPTSVDIAGSFDGNTSSTPDKWTLSSSYNNDKDIDSTTFNGVVSTAPTGWADLWEDNLSNWLDSWQDSHKYTFDTDTKNEIVTQMGTLLESQLPSNPLVPNYEVGKTTDYKVLALMAGTTFTQYVDPTNEQVVLLNPVNREGYAKYTSNDFKLDAYSFYRISVWVKTNGATASISIDGDIKNDSFPSIVSNATGTTKTYHLYAFSDGTNTINFLSETAPSSTEITYDNLTYGNKNGDVYTLLTPDPEKNYSVTDLKKSYDLDASGWTQHTIYISTADAATIKLNLALGENEEHKSSGSVYFDDVKVEKIQLLDFYNNATPSLTVAVADERGVKTTNSVNHTVVSNFENNNHNWKLENASYDNVDVITREESYYTGFTSTFPQSNATGKNKMLSIINRSTKEIAINSCDIEFQKGRYYRVSFWAYSAQSNATTKATLVSENASGKQLTVENTTKPYLADRVKEDGTSIDNFWVNYVYYVQAPAEKNVNAHLKITVPSGITLNIDHFVVEFVSKQAYTDTTAKKLDLRTEIKDEVLANGTFHSYNSVKTEDYVNLLPPTGWTSTKKFDIFEYFKDATSDEITSILIEADLDSINAEKTTITYNGKTFEKATGTNTYNYKESGTEKILEKMVFVEDKTFTYDSTKSAYTHTDYKDQEIASDVKSGISISNADYNALVFNSTTAEKMTYKSSVMKLNSTGSLYIISADIKTSVGASITLRLVDKDGKVYGTISDINTFVAGNSEWKTVKFYVGTGLETIELYLEIEYAEAAGDAEIKRITPLKTTTTTVLDNKLNKTHDELLTEKIAIVDLKSETFIEHSAEINSDTHLFDANLYTAAQLAGKTSGIYGILDTTNPHANFDGIKAKDEEVSPYVLIIKNTDGQSTKLDATKKFTVAKQKYMLITIVAKVEGLTPGKAATINFAGLNKSFSVTSSEYVEFKLYVDNKESDTATAINYSFELLDSAGTLIVDSIKIESPSDISSVKSEYKNTDTDTVKFTTTTAAAEAEKKEEEKANADEIEADDENKTLEIFLAILSSLLLVAAIIFALVFTRVKSLKKHHRKNNKNKVNEVDDGQKGFV